MNCGFESLHVSICVSLVTCTYAYVHSTYVALRLPYSGKIFQGLKFVIFAIWPNSQKKSVCEMFFPKRYKADFERNHVMFNTKSLILNEIRNTFFRNMLYGICHLKWFTYVCSCDFESPFSPTPSPLPLPSPSLSLSCAYTPCPHTQHYVQALRGTSRNSSHLPHSPHAGMSAAQGSRLIGSSPAEYVVSLLRSHSGESEGTLPVLDLYG